MSPSSHPVWCCSPSLSSLISILEGSVEMMTVSLKDPSSFFCLCSRHPKSPSRQEPQYRSHYTTWHFHTIPLCYCFKWPSVSRFSIRPLNAGSLIHWMGFQKQMWYIYISCHTSSALFLPAGCVSVFMSSTTSRIYPSMARCGCCLDRFSEHLQSIGLLPH